jgi:cytochrome-b5 reductase
MFILYSTVVDGKMAKREYTPISDETGYFELLVKRYATGPISSFLHSRKVGDQVMMRGLFGTLNWDPDTFVKNHSHLLLIGAGSGITPLYQILIAFFKSAKFKESPLKVSLIFANRTTKDILLKEKIDAIKSEHPDVFNVTYVLSKNEGDETFPVVPGRLDNADVFKQAIGGSISTSDNPFVMICGQDNFCAAIKNHLASPDVVSVPADSIHVF